jgi:tetratricopeptide (TPR) repeat protein
MHAVDRASVLLVLAITVAAAQSASRDRQPNPRSRRPQAATATFASDVAPIVYNRCSGCHRPGGGAPFSLTTYADVRRRAKQIASVTKLRYMPPWKPEPGFGEFAGDRRLNDAEIATLERWVEQGAVEGDAAPAPPLSTSSGEWQLGKPDLVVTMAAAYSLPSEGADVFRSFVLPVPLARGRFVRGLEFHPGVAPAVHHANIKIDRTHSSRRLDEAERDAGFEGGAGRDARFPEGYFLGWTPGQSPHLASEGLWRLEPDSDLVVELHMVPTGKPEPIQISVGLYLTDVPPSRIPYVLRLGSQTIDIPAGQAAHVVTDEYKLPVSADVLSVQPHAHNLAREIEGWAELPDGSTRPLIAIRDWDFRWQDVYRYVDPLRLPAGTVLRMRYLYDNSTANPRNPNRPPRRITFGQKTSSEMGDLWLQLVTRTPEDRATLDRDYAPKMLREDINGVEKMLALSPTDARLHTDLALCYLAADRAADALTHLREAVRLEPDSANARYDLGTTLLAQRQLEAAAGQFIEALRLRPVFSEARNNLGVVRFLQGRTADAVRSYERALRDSPANAEAHYNLGRALAAQHNITGAITQFSRSLELRPDNAEAHASLANALATQGRQAEAVSSYRRSLQLKPDLLPALVDLAWILANEQGALRDPREAVRLAEHAADLTAHRHAATLDTLALAYFATNQLERAIAVEEAAVKLASTSGTDTEEAVRRFRQRLEFYRDIRNRAARQTSGADRR